MKKTTCLILVLAFIFSGRAQTNFEKKIILKDSTINQTITMEIKQGVPVIRCWVNSYLSVGDLSFKIFDPENKQEGGFGLDAIVDGEKKPSSGRMTHEIKSPIPGTWKIQIRVNSATGNLSYKIHFN
jgi:hypothetical protein